MIAAAESESAQPPEGGDSLARLVAELESAPDPHAALRGIAALRPVSYTHLTLPTN